MKHSLILTLMSLGIVVGNFQVDGTTNVTLPTELTMEKIGSNTKYPKLKVNATVPITLKCVYSTTAPSVISTVTWRHNGKLLQEGEEYGMQLDGKDMTHTALLTIKKPKAQSLGTYECELNISVGGGTKKVVELIGPPVTVLPPDVSKRVAEATEYSLKCNFCANPSDDTKVEWFRDNYTLPLKLDAGMKIVDEVDSNGKVTARRNVLVFESIKTTAKGVYFCKVSNKLGEDYLGVKLRVKSRYAYLWPLIGIILEIVVVTVIIIVYEVKKNKKRKAKLLAQQNMQFSDEDCQGMPVDYDGDSEVRQRLARA